MICEMPKNFKNKTSLEEKNLVKFVGLKFWTWCIKKAIFHNKYDGLSTAFCQTVFQLHGGGGGSI